MGILRLFLACSVITGHAVSPILGIKGISGGEAVRIFFVISGFYMSLVLTDKYRSRSAFYLNRFLRLYPAFLIVAMLTWAWFFISWWWLGRAPTTDGWPEAYASMDGWQRLALIVSNWTMVGQDIPSLFHYKAGAGFSFLAGPTDGTAAGQWVGYYRTIGPAWSIGSEIWFYLTAPFLVGWRWPWLLLLGLFSYAVFFAMNQSGVVLTGYFFPALLWFFIAGIFLHRLYDIAQIHRHLALAAGVIIASIGVAMIGVISTTTALSVIVPFAFALTKRNAIDAFVGELSYPIYLLHMLVMMMLMNVFHDASGTSIAVVSIVGAVALVLVVEKPMDRIRQRIARRHEYVRSQLAEVAQGAVMAPERELVSAR